MFAFAAIALAGLARAELGANDTAVLAERFKLALLDPLFPNNFSTQGLLTAHWAATNASINPGWPLNATDAANFTGDMKVNPAPGATGFNASNLYTAILVDAGNTNTNISADAATQKLHWLINNIHLNQTVTGGPYPLDLLNGTTVLDYAGPAPEAGSGPHRYVFLVYGQPANFTPPAEYSTSQQIKTVSDFHFIKYVSDAKLGPIVGSTFFTVENGNSTQTLAPTQTSNTSLAAPTDGSAGNIAPGTNGTGTIGPNGTVVHPNGTTTGGNSSTSNPAGGKDSAAFAALPAIGFTLFAAAAAALF